MPIAGSIVGKLFYLAKREIVKNDYRLLGSKFFGHSVAFLIDLTNELASLLYNKKDNNNFSLCFISINNLRYNVSIKLYF